MYLKSSSILLGVLAMVGSPLSAGLIFDDFSKGLDNWTATVILDVNGGASNSSAFQVNESNQLEVNTTVYDDIEQFAFIRSGATLDVGEEAQIDMEIPISGNRNLGLYVGNSAPTAGVRENYITMYAESNTSRVSSRGFDGATEYNNPNMDGFDALTLFIARPTEDTFEAGYYSETERIIVTTRNPSVPNAAQSVGIYADIRSEGILGAIDTFRIIDPLAPPGDTEIVITGFAKSNAGQYVITFTGPGNQTFLVKKSSNLQDDFTTIAETEAEVITDAEGNGQAILTIPEEGLPGEFYRVESSP